MLGHRELTMEDYADILRRRKWLILASVLFFLAVGLGLTFIIHPQYQSQTLVLIEQPKVPEDYVKPVVEQDLNTRMASMKEQILSRSHLEPIIRQFNLYPKVEDMDDRIALTQKAIQVKPIPSGESSHGMPGFYIMFKANNAHVAQQVCAEITSLFVSENVTAREESAQGTTEFLKQQLDESKKNLDDQDAKLAAFQQKYFGMLPDQEQSNSNTLQSLTTQLDAVTQSLNRQQQDVTFLQAMVTQQTHDLQNAEPPANVAAVDERKAELKTLLQQKQTLEANIRLTIPTWSRSRARSPTCRRRSRERRLSRRPSPQSLIGLIRRSCNSSRRSCVPRNRPWLTRSRSRPGSKTRFATMRGESSPALRSKNSTSRLPATMRLPWTSTIHC